MPLVLSLDKSLDVLEAVAGHPEGIGTRALAKQIRINLTSVHNIGTTLKRRGYLRQDSGKRFLLGPRLMFLARHADFLNVMTEIALPHVRLLAKSVGESVLLAALVDGRIVRLVYMVSPQALAVQESEDVGSGVYCTATGKVLLAAMPAHTLEAYMREMPLVRYTPRTIASSKLRAELERVRHQGYATTTDEACEGVSGLAVPVAVAWRSIAAALGVGAPTVRFGRKRREQVLNELRKTVALIARAWWSDRSGEKPA
ncbi:MAG: IclR family transcriptional regulator [Verrucomicrobia bacterium]|nr:IclR family transcriptional regulator [Verrucomicrobiota bacterium]